MCAYGELNIFTCIQTYVFIYTVLGIDPHLQEISGNERSVYLINSSAGVCYYDLGVSLNSP